MQFFPDRAPHWCGPSAWCFSACCISFLPHSIPRDKFMSASMRWITRSFSMLLSPGFFSNMIVVTCCHLSISMLSVKAILISWVMILRMSLDASSNCGSCGGGAIRALYVPRCLPDGDVDVFSLHFLNPWITSSLVICVVIIGSLLWCSLSKRCCVVGVVWISV